MKKSTKILLILTFFLNIATIVLSFAALKKDLLKKQLLYEFIIVDIITCVYICSLFYYIKRVLYIMVLIKILVFLCNIANFGLIIARVYTAKDKGIKLTGRKIRLYLLFELIFILKFYLHFFSMQKTKNDVCKDNDYSNRDGCWVKIPSEEEQENSIQNNINSTNEELNELRKENLNLKQENKRLKEDKSKMDKNIIRKKKIEIICQYVKEKYNINISNDTLLKKFFLEIRKKCDGFEIDKSKYEEIILNYIKQRIFGYLYCPITGQMFSNPYITPDGQTFDKLAILKQIKQKGVNPITNNNLTQDDLIENKLVLDICEIIKLNMDYFNIQHFKEIKKLLKSKITKEFYKFPYVISQGNDKGCTKEQYSFVNKEKYPNLVIMYMIKQNSEIFDDNFLKLDLEIDYEKILKIEQNLIKEEEINEIKEEKEPIMIKEEEDQKNNINNEIIYKPKRDLPEE